MTTPTMGRTAGLAVAIYMFCILASVPADVVPRSFRIDKYVFFDFDARVSVYASQGKAVNLVVVHATKGRATFGAKSHCPTVAGFKPSNNLFAS
jgi:hypothetical protein